MIKLEMNVRTAAAVRQCLFREQDLYTYDPTCIPTRIIEIRNIITEIDNQIEEELKDETTDS